MHALSGCGIWEELKSNCDTHAQLGMPAAAVCTFCRVLRSTLLLLLSHNLDSQSVNRLPKSIVVLPFTVAICVLFIAVVKIRRPMKPTVFRRPQGPYSSILSMLGMLQPQALRCSKSPTIIPWPPNLLHSSQFAYTSILSPTFLLQAFILQPSWFIPADGIFR